jgi:SAM-dependent methyltransferase
LGDALRAEGVRYFPYDPYNRTEEENRWALMHPREYVVLSNTLNVIKRRKDRLAVLRLAASALAPGGRAYITVYHGDRTGRGRYTSRGWQENKLIHQYIPEIKQAFRFVVQCGPLVVAAGQA